MKTLLYAPSIILLLSIGPFSELPGYLCADVASTTGIVENADRQLNCQARIISVETAPQAEKSVKGRASEPAWPSVGATQEGLSSWYAEFSPGIMKTTANMEIFDDDGLTCAIWGVPFNTIIKVTNLDNGRSVLVRVNDRGPAKRLVRQGRIIDLTKAAYESVANLRTGLANISIEIISRPR